jgi:hypothetical protein
MDQEIYVLTSNRSPEFTTAFLDTFLPSRSALAADYPVPWLEETPDLIFYSASELISYLGENPQESYGIHWHSTNTEVEISHAMLYYTIDGHLVLGLAVAPSVLKETIVRLLAFAGVENGLMGSEQPPPDNVADFQTMAINLPLL